MRFAVALSLIGLLITPALAQRKGTSEWLELLADYPSMNAGRRAALLNRLPAFFADIDQVDNGHERVAAGLPSYHEIQRLNLLRNQALAGAVSKTFTGPRMVNADRERGYQIIYVSAEMGINVLEMGLVDPEASVQSAAKKCLEDLLPACFRPKRQPFARDGREWGAMEDFKTEVNGSYRRYAAKDTAWFASLASKDKKLLRPFCILRAESKDESFRPDLKKLLASQDESDLTLAAECLLQWPDPEFLPLLEPIMLRGSQSRVVSSVQLWSTLLAYREAAVDLVRRVKSQLDAGVQAHFLSVISRLPFGTSWDLLVESLNSPSPQVRKAAIEGIFQLGTPRYFPMEFGAGIKPKGLPENIRELTHNSAIQYIVDTNEDVRVAAVEALDYKRVEQRTWRRISADASPKVRIAVVPYLSKLDPDFALDLLWNLMIDRDEDVRREANRERIPGISLKALKEVKSPNPLGRAAAALVLGSFGASSFLEDVAPLLKDRSPIVQEAATIALLGFGEKGFALVGPAVRRLNDQSVAALLNKIAGFFPESEAISKLRSLSSNVSLAMRHHIEDLCKRLSNRPRDQFGFGGG
jgi:HEAT repeat protein